MRVTRLVDHPIVGPELDPSIGVNIQGPSLIRAPSWLETPLGRYYLYFADHKGGYIRLAFADELTGPWTVFRPGSLQLADSCFLTTPPTVTAEVLAEQERLARSRGVEFSHDLLTEITTPHIASPDVHVDEERRQVVMYFHGLEDVGTQVTRVALSQDGVAFRALPEVLGRSYMRVFEYEGLRYALAMPGQVYRSPEGLSRFEAGPMLFNPRMRHAAVLSRERELMVFWTQVGDVPERVLLSRIDLSNDWLAWRDGEAEEVLRPERDWEGADAPLVASIRSTAYGHVNQLRDPAVFEEDGHLHLLYAVAGESGIAIAELIVE